MKRFIVVIAISFAAIACNNSEQSNSENIVPTKSIVGKWKVTNYQNELLVEQSEAEIKGFESSVRLQRENMIQLSQYTFNENGSYFLQHTPDKFDKGQWLIINDSIMVQNSDIYHSSDSSVIHFNSATNVSIIQTGLGQRVTVDIELVE